MQDEWIKAASKGDQDAYRKLFEAWFAKAYRIGKAICGSRSLAEDAVQEALIRFWNALNLRRGRTLTEAYFMRIVANEARRVCARRRTVAEELPDTLPDTGAIPELEHIEKEARTELRAAVDRLPVALKSAVRLKYFGGFTEAETAEFLGISVSGAKMRLLRGRERLKAMLDDRQPDNMGGDNHVSID